MASIKDEVDLLRRIPLFANVEPHRLKLLAFTSERVRFEAGQELFHQGDPGDAAYVIISGSAEVVVDTQDGELAVATLDKNAFVGEIAILCDVPRTATVRAVGQLETLKIMKDHFLRMVAEFPEMAVEIMRVLAQRLSRTTAELTEARNRLGGAAG
ncbi:cyclic nucleotide-binding domain-containing protein [Kaustia mangrovi]|uniref:Cyclic nucleotide-binding domain-containing protein n=1 Tax=Kaustia mangrovi TaxID=2593653 RepID=A0A7S8HCU3_9HYPH|nr:cyclic nucleotide-binding domain-containing protein [Kaustia mangrovi]QPC43618.1 cyclic nucleotide-binding domain-containing protein [Kaustia mangrovi]